MEEDKHVTKPKMCDCGCGHYSYGAGGYRGWYGGHFLLRIVIIVLLMGVVFWMGVKLGELKGSLYQFGGGPRGYGHMMMRGPIINNAPIIHSSSTLQ